MFFRPFCPKFSKTSKSTYVQPLRKFGTNVSENGRARLVHQLQAFGAMYIGEGLSEKPAQISTSVTSHGRFSILLILLALASERNPHAYDVYAELCCTAALPLHCPHRKNRKRGIRKSSQPNQPTILSARPVWQLQEPYDCQNIRRHVLVKPKDSHCLHNRSRQFQRLQLLLALGQVLVTMNAARCREPDVRY